MTEMASSIDIAYLVTGVLFIFGLKYLSSPAKAKVGNRLALLGMLIALVATLLDRKVVSFELIAIGVVVGGVIGFVFARAVKMTAMPQMVALFNGAGGGAAALVAAAEFLSLVHSGAAMGPDQTITIMLSTVIGSLSFAGSIIAFLKLQELMTGRPITYPGQQAVNGVVLIVILAACVAVIASVSPVDAFYVAAVAALVLGVFFVLPIGGADMPVVISLLNACTGMAAASTGFVLGNTVLIISGALVGASGTLLTLLMGKAMNRPISNVLFGAFGKVDVGAVGGPGPARKECASRQRRGCGDNAGFRSSGDSRTRIRHGCSSGTACRTRPCKQLGRTRRGGQVRDPPRSRKNAWTYERLACRSGCAVPVALRHAGHQSRNSRTPMWRW